MAIFDDLKQPAKVEKLDMNKLKANLSESQLKVARHNYRVILSDMVLYMDINNQELKDMVAKGVIERLITYKL